MFVYLGLIVGIGAVVVDVGNLCCACLDCFVLIVLDCSCGFCFPFVCLLS